jgi:hypothetical protein
MAEITEEAVARLKQIADAHGTPWHYAPLHHFLDSARPDASTGDSMTPAATRVPLPVVLQTPAGYDRPA